MPVKPSADDRDQLEQLTAAWEEYDRTRDVSAVADFLAENVLFMPPGDSPETQPEPSSTTRTE